MGACGGIAEKPAVDAGAITVEWSTECCYAKRTIFGE
jgi:hypothetical protein